eukprot:1141188-Pelagomonas_calceolata.AAC.8
MEWACVGGNVSFAGMDIITTGAFMGGVTSGMIKLGGRRISNSFLSSLDLTPSTSMHISPTCPRELWNVRSGNMLQRIEYVSRSWRSNDKKLSLLDAVIEALELDESRHVDDVSAAALNLGVLSNVNNEALGGRGLFNCCDSGVLCHALLLMECCDAGALYDFNYEALGGESSKCRGSVHFGTDGRLCILLGLAGLAYILCQKRKASPACCFNIGGGRFDAVCMKIGVAGV